MGKAASMRNFESFLRTLFAVTAFASLGHLASASEVPYEWKGVDRIVAVGDVHGAYDNLVATLRNSGLIDKKLRWTGGTTHLVQVGDLVDRGPDSRKAMDLLMKLQEQARRKGGWVHVLMGNHEAMNIVGVLTYVSSEEFDSYKDRDSTKRRELVFQRYYREQIEEAKSQGRDVLSEKEEREKFKERYPLGYFEHRIAFHPEGTYGSWILQHNVAIRINGILFSHADWSEEMAALGLEEVNRRVREEMSGKADLEGGVAFAIKSPLQYRGFSRVPLERAAQEARQEALARILTALAATRIVVGHTMTHGVIEPRFGGKHISIDAGMLPSYGGGQQVALEIEGDRFRAIHPRGKAELPEYLDESSLIGYLSAVAAVDPDNLALRVELITQYRLHDKLPPARSTMAELFQIPRSIPERFKQRVCDLFLQVAAPGKQPNEWVAQNCGY